MSPVVLKEGTSPIILAFPHGGVHIPDNIAAYLNSNGLDRADTDWHIHKLYEGLLEDATTIQATFHRYVIDANRDPEGHSLYPGQNTTGLCPLTDFDGNGIWRDEHKPVSDDVEERLQAYHVQYHLAVAGQIERVKSLHGRAIIYDCHSIRSLIPHLFDGKLPDFNIGTNEGNTCASSIEEVVVSSCSEAIRYSHVLNGRFKGGWTTRRYGNPEQGVHAAQMELAQSTYMSEQNPWKFDDTKAQKLRLHLKSILTNLEALALEGRV
jgi:formiminoglutamase|tara:strand:- start:78 stop:875 length:798 start_codon:yes stop_codon:yes gene_type:complete